nr:MAG TPA: hypothetical protein [Bacteriophage sp.]
MSVLNIFKQSAYCNKPMFALCCFYILLYHPTDTCRMEASSYERQAIVLRFRYHMIPFCSNYIFVFSVFWYYLISKLSYRFFAADFVAHTIVP